LSDQWAREFYNIRSMEFCEWLKGHEFLHQFHSLLQTDFSEAGYYAINY